MASGSLAAARHGRNGPDTSGLERTSSPTQSGRPPTTGSRNALPMLPRSAFHENGLADAPRHEHAGHAAASAARTSAPTLPGSCTSTRDEHERSRHRADIARRVAGAPRRDGHDAGRRADRTHRGEDRRQAPARLDAGSLEHLRERALPLFPTPSETMRPRASSKRVARGVRVAHQVGAVEQHTRAVESAESASARNRATMGFWRLEMERISWLVDRGWLSWWS